MLEQLKVFINQIVAVSEEEWANFSQKVEAFTFAKNEMVLKAGQHCEHVYFVNKGLGRFTMLIENKEKTISLIGANELAVEVYSFYSGMPCISNFEALTELELLGISRANLEELYNTSKNWERFGRIIAQFGVVDQVMQKIDMALKTPEARYKELIEKKPYLLNEVSLGIIASYLGITQETLSRIRGRI
jgi:CRP-like cAMP-binding protein